MQRRHFHLLAAVAAFGAPAFAQARPLRLLVPFPPGGATDITARVLAEPLGRLLGQTVVVDNRGGAGGSLGMAELARAAPDGNTFGLATLSTHGVNPAVYSKLPYDPIKDFAPVTEIVKAPGVLAVHPSVKANTIAEFIALLKANPGRITYASPGNGTIGHMWAELFKSTTNTFMLHIPYRGAGPALNDLLAGQVQAHFDQVASSLPHIQSGKLRALAVSWGSRLKCPPMPKPACSPTTILPGSACSRLPPPRRPTSSGCRKPWPAPSRSRRWPSGWRDRGCFLPEPSPRNSAPRCARRSTR